MRPFFPLMETDFELVLRRPIETARLIGHYVNPAQTIILKCD
jgi:hypothetical protein